MSETAATPYIMGHTDNERRRLAAQAAILRPFTEELFRRAGISAGMNIVDVGCGVGDVSLIAAGLTGRTGSVTSIDIDPDALETLQRRAEALGLPNIACIRAEIQSFQPQRRFDAVVGRHILIHTKDPLAALKTMREWLHPRGLAAFQEYDFQQLTPSGPATPLRDSAFALCNRIFAALGRANVGSRLFRLFTEAGFAHPDCRGEFPVDAGPESPFHEWIAEALRSLLPHARALNIEGAEALDIDSLATRLAEEARAGSAICGPLMFSCFARAL